ncbi:glycolate oxidase FAD binding subunit [Roseateles sp. YR242]|uniref:glycolate oxidase subunit GlcE n=1 Tax=Roseateles sp. YR242 TaxID=1855305 RepID=UPI0008B10920|nr:glycolate oxidase subunit GlcE [Roseateles sp. YR242]SEK79359.1 glycolate oxidase FAD binding subunit [Roseateles sp. YR242]
MTASVELDRHARGAAARPTPLGPAALSAPLTEAVETLQARIRAGGPLRIEGHGSKHFYGGELKGETLSTRALHGVLAYEPSELYVTAAAGTSLAELEATLADQGQHLAFEPPRFSDGSLGTGTVGGMVAAGLSGPARSTAGAVRDHVLGLSMINGRGELLHFGGTVMKNVAGYDVSRLMAGAMGVLGLMVQVTLKVLPRPVASTTLRFELPQDQALLQMNRWGGLPLPISATAWWDGALVVRLSGADAAVRAAMQRMGGDLIPAAMADPFWRGLRDQDDEFFIGARRAVQGGASMWRIGVPATAPAMSLHGEQLIEWGGAQRWVVTPMAPAQLRDTVASVGGHATLFRARDKTSGVFSPLSVPLARIHRELKAQFDPEGRFNPGRLYPDL